jgi:hypothetical protein
LIIKNRKILLLIEINMLIKIILRIAKNKSILEIWAAVKLKVNNNNRWLLEKI